MPNNAIKMSKECVFCRVATGQEQSTVVFENDWCLAITPLEIEVDGHLIIIPKAHHENIFDIPDNQLKLVLEFTKHICKQLKADYAINGINLLHASGSCAQQSIGHFHIHLLPRFEGDNVNAWPDLPGGKSVY